MNKENQALYNLVSDRLAQLKINPDENLGQHFLVDQIAIDLLTGCVAEGGTVIEVGAGVGQLTERLAEKAMRAISIEIDKRYEPLLTQVAHEHQNVKIILGDALLIDFKKYLPAQIISSLPYHITEPFLHKIAGLGVQNAVLVVGDKLGRAIQVSDEQDKDFSQRTLLVQIFFKTELLNHIDKKGFFPKPRTNSVIVRLTPKKEDDFRIDKRAFILRKLFLTSSDNPLVKNCIKEALIEFSTNQLTQNQARDIIASLKISESILKKPFDQLNNRELSLLSRSLRSL